MNEAELRQHFQPHMARLPLDEAGHRPAAVLVALEPERGVWLTRRSADLHNHAGQVALPGGQIEASDTGVEAAALREAAEEIGLDGAGVEIIGRLDDFIVGTGFHISPVVALVPKNVALRPNPDEVQAIFCLPFATLLDPAQPARRHAYWRGHHSEFWVWPHEQHIIWGATASILYMLAQRLRKSP